VGGDEFVCSLAGQDMVGARVRFDEISRELVDAIAGATITVGLASAHLTTRATRSSGGRTRP